MTNDWLTTRLLAPGVWVIQEPIGRAAPGYDVVIVNMYVVEGRDRAAVIDSGMGIADLLAACRALTSKPLLSLSTHSHWDHVGGAYQFGERLISPLEAHRIAEDYDVEGVTHIRAAPATGELIEGGVVDLGGRSLAVWHTPGHSPGHVSLLDSATGFLFCADTCYAGTLWMQTEDANLPDWRASLERIAASGVAALCGGHEEPLQPVNLAAHVLAALDEALAGKSVSEPFDFDPGTRKHRFDGFSILLREV
ncbi:MAG TPA: MBL fold metallo-hydrolase [Ktedonobacterales bacterium]|nr:MBL fold metallo-hydrolase [Ktedonobacterales bacterium]